MLSVGIFFAMSDFMYQQGFEQAPRYSGFRNSSEIMTAENLGATKAYRLSFARSLIRKMTTENWKINLEELKVDAGGVGLALYKINTKNNCLRFLIFSNQVSEKERTGRLSESKFDGMAAILDGVFLEDRVELEYAEMLKRSEGQTVMDAIAWTLSTRSSRFFSHTVCALAEGKQPIFLGEDIGAAYLLRNNGCYGNGRHGTRMWGSLEKDHPLANTYYPEMFALYMWRQFGFDLVEEMARQINPTASRLRPEIKRYLGIGNSTGQGMSTFVVKWPRWINAWNLVREKAIVTASEQQTTHEAKLKAKLLIKKYISNLEAQGRISSPQFLPAHKLALDLKKIDGNLKLDDNNLGSWVDIICWCRKNTHREAVEQFHSILTEVHGDRIDSLEELFVTEMEKTGQSDPQMTIAQLRELIHTYYSWAFSDKLCGPDMTHYFFYRSEEHGEQRRGQRRIDAGSANETFTGVPTAVRQLDEKLKEQSNSKYIAVFLAEYPEYRFIVERIQTFWNEPYAEIRTSVPGYAFHPAHVIRFVLATFGMETVHFSTKKWVQGTFFQGAPISEQLHSKLDPDWFIPEVPDGR